MKTIFDVQQILKRFGIYVYVGDRLADLELMELELTELFKSQFIQTEEFQKAILLLRHESTKIQKEKGDAR